MQYRPRVTGKKIARVRDRTLTEVLFDCWIKGVIVEYREADIEHLDTKVDADGQPYILVETTRTTHIKSGILYDRLRLVGSIEEYEKKINLNSDRKRFWLDNLAHLDQQVSSDSTPINADLVAEAISKENGLEWMDDESVYEPESHL